MITVVRNIRQLVTPRGVASVPRPGTTELVVHARVQLVVHDGRIAEIVSHDRDVRADRTIDAADGIVVPGLVDACVSATPARDSGDGSPDGSFAYVRSGAATVVRQGTTSAAVCAATSAAEIEGLLAGVQQLAQRGALRVTPAFLAAPPLGTRPGSDDRISAMIGETIPSVSRRRLASTCVVVCGEDGFSRKEARAVLRAARGAGLRLRLRASGADTDALLAAVDVPVDAIDHLAAPLVGPRAAATLRKTEAVPILLPAAGHSGADRGESARPFLDAGLAVAIASDADLIGGGVLSLWTAVSLAVRRMGMTLDEAVVAASRNAAVAVGCADDAGTLEPGKQADFAIVDLGDYRRIPDFVVGLPIRSVFIGGTEVGR